MAAAGEVVELGYCQEGERRGSEANGKAPFVDVPTVEIFFKYLGYNSYFTVTPVTQHNGNVLLAICTTS